MVFLFGFLVWLCRKLVPSGVMKRNCIQTKKKLKEVTVQVLESSRLRHSHSTETIVRFHGVLWSGTSLALV